MRPKCSISCVCVSEWVSCVSVSGVGVWLSICLACRLRLRPRRHRCVHDVGQRAVSECQCPIWCSVVCVCVFFLFGFSNSIADRIWMSVCFYVSSWCWLVVRRIARVRVCLDKSVAISVLRVLGYLHGTSELKGWALLFHAKNTTVWSIMCVAYRKRNSLIVTNHRKSTIIYCVRDLAAWWAGLHHCVCAISVERNGRFCLALSYSHILWTIIVE